MNKFKLRGAASVGALIMAMASAGVAAAQEVKDTTIGEIVVTANRREQSVLQVPYNISAVSGEAIEDSKMLDAAELMRGIPGVAVVDRGYRNGGVVNNVLIRGINVDSNALGDYAVSSVAPVSTYQNDTPLFAGFLLKDLDRVEVLRGPQGTLYGSGSLGGTVRYITRAPKLGQFGGAANVTASKVEGSGNLGWTGDLTVNLPLGEVFALRATLSQIDYPGLTDYVNLYVLDSTGAPAAPNGVLSPNASYTSKKDADTVEISFARAALLFEPNDRFNATLTYSHQSDEVGGRRQVTRGLDGYGNRYGDYENGSVQLEPSSREVSLTALEMNVDLGFATLTSSTSIYDHEGESVSENTGFYAKAGFLSFYYNYPRPMASAVRGYSDKAAIEEIRLVSKAGGDFDYVVGLYYNDNSLVATQQSHLRGFKRWWDIWSGVPSAVAGDQDFAYRRHEDFTEKAVYGELTWRPSDSLALTGGVRWFENEAINTTSIDVPLYTSLSQPANARFESSESKALFKANLSWDFAEKGLFYATVSQGYRRGGSNAVPLTGNFAEDPRWQTYKSDSVVNYEAGLKGVIPNLNATYEAALFQIDWDDIQLLTTDVASQFTYYTNGSTARSRGLELSGRWSPVHGLSIDGAATYLDAKLTDRLRSPAGASPIYGSKGDRLPGSAKTSVSLSAQYDWSVGRGISAFAGASLAYVGDRYAEFANILPTSTANAAYGARVELPSYTTFDLRAGAYNDDWRLTAYVKNLGDRRGIVEATTRGGTSSPQAIFLQPRTIGATLSRSF